MTLDRIVTTIILGHVVETMTLDTNVAFDTIDAFLIPLVVLLTSSPMMWRKEQLWNFSVLQRVHFSNLVILLSALLLFYYNYRYYYYYKLYVFIINHNQR
jgi:hypothetical protein